MLKKIVLSIFIIMSFVALFRYLNNSFFATKNVRAQSGGGFIIDHTSVSLFDQIPDQYITQAKSQFKISYGHTSHGSQVVTGMQMVNDEFGDLYSFTSLSSDCNDSVFLCDRYPPGDLGNPDRMTWADRTRDMLNDNQYNRNFVIWAWCWQHNTSEENINLYLDQMNDLERDFPDVKFVYMTGHLNGGDGPPNGNTYLRNEQIRKYARDNNKILFDFADIESWDPDGNDYRDGDDACDWCVDWCAVHSCPTCSSCAHSHCFNCYLKGKAFWVMMAKALGWNPGGEIETCEQQNGYICSANQICLGDWLTASDTNRCCSQECEEQSVPKIDLEKQADRDSVGIGEEIVYTISYTNNSQSPAQNVIIRDIIPNGTVYISGGTYSNGKVEWNVGNIESGASGSVELMVRVD